MGILFKNGRFFLKIEVYILMNKECKATTFVESTIFPYKCVVGGISQFRFICELGFLNSSNMVVSFLQFMEKFIMFASYTIDVMLVDVQV